MPLDPRKLKFALLKVQMDEILKEQGKVLTDDEPTEETTTEKPAAPKQEDLIEFE